MNCLRFACSMLAIAMLHCADSKAEQQDFDNICNAPEKSGANAEPNPSLKAAKIAKWLPDNIKTEKAKDFMKNLASAPPSSKGQRLKDAAKAAGYQGACPLAE